MRRIAMDLKERIWKSFIANDSVDLKTLPKHVAHSWLHCRKKNVDPFGRKNVAVIKKSKLKEKQQKNKRIIELLEKELKTYQQYFQLKMPIFILTDADGYIIWRDGYEQTKRLANAISFIEGHRWLEEDAGTNAISLALQTGEVTTLRGYEHYSVTSHNWECTAVAIQDEFGDICAALDISSHLNNSAAQPEVHLFLQLLANIISEKLRNDSLISHKQLLDYAFKMICPGIVCNKYQRIVTISKELMLDEDEWFGCNVHELLTKQFYQVLPEMIMIDGELIGYYYPILKTPQKQTNFFYSGVASKNKNYQQFMNQVEKIAASMLSIHIHGESGSGKEIIAKTIHQNSPVSSGPLVAINCGAIYENLLESELFGYAPGAFTGASNKGYRGKIMQANGGTLFLDEVDSMSLRMQAALLRVLEDKKVTQLGSTKAETVSFRIVTASNRNLKELVQDNKFRLDLFYRLYVCPITIPPLRERKEDIYVLMQDFCNKHHWYPRWINNAYAVAKEYNWNGNIRELNNFLERLHLYYQQDTPTISDLQHLIEIGSVLIEQNEKLQQNSFVVSPEQRELEEVLKRHQHRISHAAKELGIARSTLYRKMKKYNLK